MYRFHRIALIFYRVASSFYFPNGLFLLMDVSLALKRKFGIFFYHWFTWSPPFSRWKISRGMQADTQTAD